MGVLIRITDVPLVVHDLVDGPGFTGRGDSALAHLGCQPGSNTWEVAHVLASLGHSSAANALRAS